MSNRTSIFLFSLILLFAATFAHGQNVRWDLGAPGGAGAVTTAGSGQPFLVALPGVQLNWCSFPANGVPCTNFAPTYQGVSSGNLCASNQPIVLQGSATCQGTSDNFGNLGVYTASGTYAYTLTYSGASYGPYVTTVGGSGSGVNILPTNNTFTGSNTFTSGVIFNPAAGNGVQYVPTPLASAPACVLPGGNWASISDSTTNNQGAAITGGGAYKVFAFCNGVNYVVSSGTSSGGGGPNPVQGYQVRTNSSASVTTPIDLDASAFCTGGFSAGSCLSGDMCQAISAAIGSNNNISGVIDARAFTGPQYCAAANATTMLYGGAESGGEVNGQLLIGNVEMVIDGPSAGYFTDGVGSTYGTPAIILPNQFWGIRGVDKAESEIAFCYSAGHPLSACTHGWPQRAFTITSTTISGNTLTVNVSGSPFVVSGAGQNIWATEEVSINNSSVVSNDILRQVKTTTASAFTVSVPSTTLGCSANCGTANLYTPLIGYATATVGQPYLPVQAQGGVQSFGQHVEDVGLLLNSPQSVYGVTGIQNINGGEVTGMDRVEIEYNCGIGFQFGSGSSDSGPYDNLRVTNLNSTTCTNPATTALVNAGPDRGVFDYTFVLPYPRGVVSTSGTAVTYVSGTNFTAAMALQPITINSVSYVVATYNSSTSLTLTSSAGVQTSVNYSLNQPNACIYADAASFASTGTTDIKDGHVEGCADGIEIGANGATRGIKVDSLLGMPNGLHQGVNLVHLMLPGVNEGSLIFNVTQQSGGSSAAILDDPNGITCTDLTVSSYITDLDGNAIYSCIDGTFGSDTQITGLGIITPAFELQGFPTTPTGLPFPLVTIPESGAMESMQAALPGIVGRAVEAATPGTNISYLDCYPKRIEYEAFTGAGTDIIPTPTTMGVTWCNFKVVIPALLSTGAANNVTQVCITPSGTATINGSTSAWCFNNGQAGVFFVDPLAPTTGWVVDPVGVDINETQKIVFANCVAGSAQGKVDSASSNFAAACRAGSNNLGGSMQAIPSTGASLQISFELPADWDATAQPFINVFFGSGSNTSNTVIWTASSACSSLATNGGTTDDPTFHAETAFATDTMTTANRMWYSGGEFTQVTSANGCTPGSTWTIKLALSGTATANINAYKAVITVPRLNVQQAN
jgi:hypothetical protein